MNNVLKMLTVIAVLIAGAVSARADSWMDQLQAAVASGDMGKVDLLAATHTDQQGDIAAYLFQQASSVASTDAAKADKLLGEAKSYAAQMNAAQTQQAAGQISTLLTLASDSGFQSAHPDAAGDILTSIINIAAQANVAAASPTLENNAINAAKSYEASAPAGVKTKLEQVVSLAQTQSIVPHATISNVHIPSAGQ